jgi:hypothetical protein
MSKQLDFEAYLASAILSPDGIASESLGVRPVVADGIECEAKPHDRRYVARTDASVEIGSGLGDDGAFSSMILCARIAVASLIRSKSGRTRRPSCVSRTFNRLRSNNGRRIPASSVWMARVSEGCATPQRVAARVKLCSSQSATK